MSPELKVLFEPKSVVVLGASELKGEDSFFSTLFTLVAHNVSKFRKVKIVDLSGKLAGSEKNLNRVPKDRDLGVVLLPKKHLQTNLPKLLARRVRALVLMAGELDEKEREKLSGLVKRKRLLLLGPNATMGVLNTANDLLAAPERGQMPRKGHVAVISQDGSVAAAMLDRARSLNVGISKMACMGEGLGVDEADLLRYLAQDKETKAVCVYIESAKNGRKFAEAIRELVGNKPVIVLKGGPERDGVFEAALKQAGALQANDIEELFGAAEVLVKQPPLRGHRIAVATNFPGLAMLAARYLSDEGFEIVPPSKKTAESIMKKCPGGRVEGFVDLGPTEKADHFKFAVEQLLSDEGVDGVMVINAIKSGMLVPEDLRKIAEGAKKSKEKPVVDVVVSSEDYTIAREILADTELPVYDGTGNAARAMKMLSLRGKILEKAKK